jgi:hypothetical protein
MKSQQNMSCTGEDGSSPHASAHIEKLRRSIAATRNGWPAFARRTSQYASVTWTPEGPKLGTGTLLARSVAGEEMRILALLSVAFDRPVQDSVVKNLRSAEREYQAGDHVKSAIHVSLANMPPLISRESNYRLHMAATLLDQGLITADEFFKAAEFDPAFVSHFAKYNEDEPRIPAGNVGAGQWTRGDNIVPHSPPPKDKSSKPVQTAIVMPEGCEEEWKWAHEYCLDVLKKPNPPRGVTGGYSDPFLCAKGLVSERCGGNPVQRRPA